METLGVISQPLSSSGDVMCDVTQGVAMKPFRVFLLTLVLALLATLGATANASLPTGPRTPGAPDDRLDFNGHFDLRNFGLSAPTPTHSRLTANRAADASVAAAAVIQITPRSGVPGTEVRIQGAGFTATSTVTFGGTVLPLSSVTFVAPTQLRALVPQKSGLVTVCVTTGGEATPASTFSVLTPFQGFALLDATASSLPPRLVESRSGLFMDADGDSDLDLFISEHIYPPDTPLKRMRLLMNNGAGQFSDETDTRMPELLGTPANAQSGDVDGDGDEDILANTQVGYTPPSHPGSLLINDGSGHFTNEWSSRVPRVECPTGVLGDVDGDGDLDLLLPCWWPADQQLFLNDGTGHFALGGSFPARPSGSVSFVFGDVDDDGDLDALGEWSIYINDGHGQFVDETETRLPDSAGYNGVQSVLADLDGDGDLDGIVLGSAHDPEYVLINDGTGHFSRSQQLPAVYAGNCYWSPCYEPGDIDSDGDIDLVIPDPSDSSPQNIVLLNQGNAQFEEPSSPWYNWLWGACRDQGGTGNKICQNAALGDVNNDGALDLFLARGGGLDTVQQSLLFKRTELAAKSFLPVIMHRAP